MTLHLSATMSGGDDFLTSALKTVGKESLMSSAECLQTLFAPGFASQDTSSLREIIKQVVRGLKRRLQVPFNSKSKLLSSGPCFKVK